MINSFGTGKPTEFFLFLFSSLLPITQKTDCYRSQQIIKGGLMTSLVPRDKYYSSLADFSPFWGSKSAQSRII